MSHRKVDVDAIPGEDEETFIEKQTSFSFQDIENQTREKQIAVQQLLTRGELNNALKKSLQNPPSGSEELAQLKVETF
jgi:hypothetical protein